MNFRTQLVNFCKVAMWGFNKDCTGFIDQFGEYYKLYFFCNLWLIRRIDPSLKGSTNIKSLSMSPILGDIFNKNF